MKIDSTYSTRGSVVHPAAGLFTDWPSANDAIADLSEAGFTVEQIVVATSVAGQQAPYINHGKNAREKHGLTWKFRHSFEHDLHRKVADQVTALGEDSSQEKDHPAYSERALEETLASMGVSEQRIALLAHEMGRDGVLILVRTGDRIDEAEKILELNQGRIKTDTATECIPTETD